MPASGVDIKNRWFRLAEDVFGFSFVEYLTRHGGRLLYGYLIDAENRRVEPLFGEPPAELTETINSRFVDSKAGYRVDISGVFPSVRVNADVLLVAKDLVSASEVSLDTILLHELCHMLIDSKHRSVVDFAIDKKDRYYGEKLFRKTDFENQTVTKHTREFCDLLAAAAQRLSELRHGFKDRAEVIQSAMRYDLRR